MTRREKKLIEKKSTEIREFIKSPEGKEAFRLSAEDIRKMKERFAEEAEIRRKTFRKAFYEPMTI